MNIDIIKHYDKLICDSYEKGFDAIHERAMLVESSVLFDDVKKYVKLTIEKIKEFFKECMNYILKYFRGHIDKLTVTPVYDTDGILTLKFYQNVTKLIREVRIEEEGLYEMLDVVNAYKLLKVASTIVDRRNILDEAKFKSPKEIGRFSDTTATDVPPEGKRRDAITINTIPQDAYEKAKFDKAGDIPSVEKVVKTLDSSIEFLEDYTDREYLYYSFRSEDLYDSKKTTGIQSLIKLHCKVMSRHYNSTVEMIYGISEKSLKRAKKKTSETAKEHYREFKYVRKVIIRALNFKELVKKVAE